MKPDLEPPYISESKGKKIEEKGPFGLGGKGDQLPLLVRHRLLVNELEVGRLAAKPGTVIDNLAVYFSCRIVYKGHLRFLSEKLVDVFIGYLSKG
jgi:hypothetical protein